MALSELSFNFSGTISGGSGPFKTAIGVEVPLALDMPTVLSEVSDWWEAASTFRGYFASTLGAPLLLLQGEFSGIVVEESLQTASAPTGGAPDLPGASMRAVKLGSRPVGGKRGSMFWPGLSGTVTQATGIVDSTPATNMHVALEALRTAVEGAAAGAYLAQRHVVDGVESVTPVIDFDISNTLTFMNRRYR